MSGVRRSPSAFDDYADDYESALVRGISVSGEGGAYFARGRVELTVEILRR